MRLQAGQKCRAGAVPDAVAAVCVYEVVCDSPSGAPGSVTLSIAFSRSPCAWRCATAAIPRALWLAVGVQEQSPAERAPSALEAQQLPGRGIDREAGAASPLLLVPGEGGIVWRRLPGNHPVQVHFRPRDLRR